MSEKLEVLETEEGHFLTIGNGAPWDNERFRVSEELAIRLIKHLKNKKE